MGTDLPPRVTTVSGGVNAKLADFENLVGRNAGRLGAAQQSFDASGEFARAERLGDVIVGAEFEADHAIGFFAFGGEDENREGDWY